MNRKNVCKIVLDAMMLIVLTLMYSKRAISMSFHEVGGLALVGVTLVHVLINARWVARVTAKLFRRGTAAVNRFSWAVDALLLVSFLMIGVSGALISKTVFSFNAGGAWKTLHYFFAALAIVLMGVHLGLHAAFIGRMLGKLTHLRGRAARIVAIVMTAALVLYGGHSLFTTSFGQWISAPFSSGMGGGERYREQAAARMTEDGAAASGEESRPRGQGNEQGKGLGDGQGKRQDQGGSLLGALTVFAQFLGEMTVFAVITAGIQKALQARRKMKRRAGAASAY